MRNISTALVFIFLVNWCFCIEPLPNLTITIEQSPSGLVKNLPTDKDGKATFTSLPPGKYWITLNATSEKTQKIENVKLNQHAIVARIPDVPAGSARVIPAPVTFEKTISIIGKKMKVVVTVNGTSLTVQIQKPTATLPSDK